MEAPRPITPHGIDPNSQLDEDRARTLGALMSLGDSDRPSLVAPLPIGAESSQTNPDIGIGHSDRRALRKQLTDVIGTMTKPGSEERLRAVRGFYSLTDMLRGASLRDNGINCPTQATENSPTIFTPDESTEDNGDWPIMNDVDQRRFDNMVQALTDDKAEERKKHLSVKKFFEQKITKSPEELFGLLEHTFTELSEQTASERFYDLSETVLKGFTLAQATKLNQTVSSPEEYSRAIERIIELDKFQDRINVLNPTAYTFYLSQLEFLAQSAILADTEPGRTTSLLHTISALDIDSASKNSYPGNALGLLRVISTLDSVINCNPHCNSKTISRFNKNRGTTSDEVEEMQCIRDIVVIKLENLCDNEQQTVS